jgi:hypothetical protein
MMTLQDETAPGTVARSRETCSSDERAEHHLTNSDPEQLQELRDSAVAAAEASLRRHRTLREFIMQVDQLIDATSHFQESLWG